MEFRETIENKLKEIDTNVYYGRVPEDIENQKWNYIVFGKNKLTKNDKNDIDLQDSYWISICRENFIPDETIISVINSLKSISGFRLSTSGGDYDYVFKKNTDLVVEIVTVIFTRTLKCGSL